MVLEKIPYDYISTIPEQQPIPVGFYESDIATGTRTPSVLVIPPINTNITISQLPKFDPKVHARMMLAQKTKDIPEKHKDNFNWMTDKRDDQPSSITKQVTKVGNQYACGCCWAFSCSDAVSDSFVINQKTSENPECSFTYAMSCYPNCKDFSNPSTCTGNESSKYPYSYQCNGGAIAPLLMWISENGIASHKCQNADWCSKRRECVMGTVDTTSLNYFVPSCGCKQNSSQKLYYISTPISKGISDDNPSSSEIQQHVNLIKNWIYNYGTVVTGFFVYSNLMSGKFYSQEKNPDGIYLEDVDYNSFQLFDNQINNFQGGHAVCIVGWGIGQVANSLISDRSLRNTKNTHTRVPYWITRNSWTTQWGNNGLFHMAMYPFNKVAQFDKYVVVNTPQGRGEAGGQILFMPQKIESKTISKESFTYNSQESSHSYIIWIFMILAVLFFLILIFVSYRIYRKK